MQNQLIQTSIKTSQIQPKPENQVIKVQPQIEPNNVQQQPIKKQQQKQKQLPKQSQTELSHPICIFGSNLQQLKQKYNRFKQKKQYKNKQLIPIIFKHYYECKTQLSKIPEYNIIMIVTKNISIRIIYSTFVSLIRKKWNINQNESLYVIKQNKKVLNMMGQRTIQQQLKQMNVQKQFIQWKYTFSSEMIQGDIDGLIYILPIIAIVAVPILIYMGGRQVVKWTANTAVSVVNKIPTPFKVKANSKFKQQFTFQSRVTKYNQIIDSNPFVVPIIIQKHQLSTLPELTNKKFLVQPTKTFQQIRYFMNKKILDKQIDQSSISIYFYFNGRVVSQSMTLKDIYEKYKDKDGFLYITYQEQETF